jgi:hypothetical protein
MPRHLADYTIPQDGLALSAALRTWAWLLPASVTVWVITRLGDMLLILDDGSVHLLDVGGGTLDRLADSREELARRIDEGDNADLWFMFGLIDACVAAGLTLGLGQCYGFVLPPVLGGEYAVRNLRPVGLAKYVAWCGDLHGQIKTLPDGTKVVLRPGP